MLNEERVKHMTKLAFYEMKGGSEDMKISSRFKKDYIGFHTFWAGLWFTLAYMILMVLVVITFVGDLIEEMSRGQMLAVVMSIMGLYLILLIAYTTKAKKIHKKRHARAYHRVKKFKEELEELEKMYEKEDSNE